MRQVHRGTRLIDAYRVRRALVECHGDVRPEPCLDLGRNLWSEQALCPIEVRTKSHAGLVYGRSPAEAEHLIPTAISQDRTRPTHEAMETAGARNSRIPGPEHQVIRIGQHHLGAQILQIAVQDRLDRTARPDRHERRRAHGAVRGLQYAAPSQPIDVAHLEVERSDRVCHAGHSGMLLSSEAMQR